MTDEKVKEEFDKNFNTLPSEMCKAFVEPYSDNLLVSISAASFYAGFRVAEQLAKIEVLEELQKAIINSGLTAHGIRALLSTFISESKAVAK